jgi:ABC-type transport system involved in multi-copper enzyme maturation permease subunit/ABC-type uncharacterized transport system involved in gliding motility auxiliary subunit
MNFNVLFAIFRRNFVSYFTNPTGYVFLCGFVLLSGIAAFWPNEFFNANLANLDQLNKYLPYILLVFIPAITMGIWADERRQGTDELLLTIPAGDLEVVLGKYLAVVAIYSVSLLYSALCNFVALWTLGGADLGLFAAQYFGYWLVGIAMLAIGMVASFLTNNLTVAYILGAAFIAPLVFAADIDVLLGAAAATAVKRWSVAGQFYDFSRGVVSLASMAYFLLIAGTMLYLCMVLIGRRHWQGGAQSSAFALHYSIRFLSLGVVAVALTAAFHHLALRADVTSERLNSLSPQTRTLLQAIDPARGVEIDAYISPNVPEEYVQTRLNLLNLLNEMATLGSGRLTVRIHDTEPDTDIADQADDLYGIKPRAVAVAARGARQETNVFLGVAVRAADDRKVVIPFFDHGVPIEYELIRSVATLGRKQTGTIARAASGRPIEITSDNHSLATGDVVRITGVTGNEAANGTWRVTRVNDDRFTLDGSSAQGEDGQSGRWQRLPPRVGVLKTRAILFAETVRDPFNQMAQPQRVPEQRIISELKRQYEVDLLDPKKPIPLYVDPDNPTTRKYDVLMVVQPSTLSSRGIGHLMEAIRAGQPTVIFEDPLPIPGWVPIKPPWFDMDTEDSFTSGQQRSINDLWTMLGIQLQSNDVVWDNYNPYPTFQLFNRVQEFVVAGDRANDFQPFNENEAITAGLRHVLFPFPGHITRMRDSKVGYARLVTTSPLAGTMSATYVRSNNPFLNRRNDPDYAKKYQPSGEAFALAVRVRGQVPPAPPPAASGSTTSSSMPPVTLVHEEGEPGHTHDESSALNAPTLNVVVVSDIDCISTPMFELRDQGPDAGAGVPFDFDNVTFVSNIIDVLSGDEQLVGIRARKFRHRTLVAIEQASRTAEEEAKQQIKALTDQIELSKQRANEALEKEKQAARQRMQAEGKSQDEIQRQLNILEEHFRLQRAAEDARAVKETNRKLRQIERRKLDTIEATQNEHKMRIVGLPPLLPLLIGLAVFINRRAREREGVRSSRLR